MYFTATALVNGKVLVVGGTTRAEILSSAELYDPEINEWTHTADLGIPLLGHTATLLTNGKVLVAPVEVEPRAAQRQPPCSSPAITPRSSPGGGRVASGSRPGVRRP
jgi:hypothetical protein